MITDREKEKISELNKKGLSISWISRETGLDRKTVRKYLPNEKHDTNAVSQQGFSTSARVPESGVKLQTDMETVGSSEVGKQKALKELKRFRGVEEESELIKKRREIEMSKLELEEYKAKIELKNLTSSDLNKIRDEEESKQEQKKVELHNKWIREWQECALNYVKLVSDLFYVATKLKVDLLSPEIKFKIKDGVKEVLKNRSEIEDNKEDIKNLVTETVFSIVKPYIDKLNEKNREEDAKRIGERKIKFIKEALEVVDIYISTNCLNDYVDDLTKREVKEEIYNYLVDTMPEDITSPPYIEVSKMSEVEFKDIKQEKEETERIEKEAKKQAREEKEREERRKHLIKSGVEQIGYYLLKNSKELPTVDYMEREEAKKYLREELEDEIEGDELEREVKELAHEILDYYFFEESGE